VRKLLVASQKGGVGKTTASVNLAAAAALAGSRVLLLDADPLSTISTALNLTEHPQRKALKEIGIPLPGVMVSEVIPGLDILCPYDDGGCPDEAFDDLLQSLAAPAFQECYATLVVNAPPFMGTNPGQLVGACEEFVLVMRAEAMAHRTLPAFMQLVDRTQSKPNGLRMRGILLTLPAGEMPGGRWERELRGRFGSRVLPQVIPHDEEVARALMDSRIVTHASPESTAAVQYRTIVENLGLVEKGRGVPAAEVAAALRIAASSLQTAGTAPAEPRVPAVTRKGSSGVLPRSRPLAPRSLPQAEPETVPDRKSAVPETVREPRQKTREPIRPRRSGARPAGAAATLQPAPVAPSRSLPPAPDPPSPPAPPQPAASIPPLPRAVPQAALPRPGAQPVQRPTPRPAQPPQQLWPLWLSLGIIVGIGLRFLPPSQHLLPTIVGVGVAAVVLLLIRTLGRSATPPASTAAAPPPKPVRLEAKADAATRLQAMTRRPTRPYKGDSRRH
jgi:chromosome partitioning protein